MFGAPSGEDFIFVDVDVDVNVPIIEVHGYLEQGSSYGYSKVRGLNAVLATALREDTAPVIIGQRLQKGAPNTARGANTFVTEALGTLKRPQSPGPVVCLFDSAYYGHPSVSAAWPVAPMSRSRCR